MCYKIFHSGNFAMALEDNSVPSNLASVLEHTLSSFSIFIFFSQKSALLVRRCEQKIREITCQCHV